MVGDYGSVLAHVLFSACIALLALHFIGEFCLLLLQNPSILLFICFFEIPRFLLFFKQYTCEPVLSLSLIFQTNTIVSLHAGTADGITRVVSLEFELLACLCGAVFLLFAVEVVLARRRDRRLNYAHLRPNDEEENAADIALTTTTAVTAAATATAAAAPPFPSPLPYSAAPANAASSSSSSEHGGGATSPDLSSSSSAAFTGSSRVPSSPAAERLTEGWRIRYAHAEEAEGGLLQGVGSGRESLSTQVRGPIGRMGSQDDEEKAIGFSGAGASL
jgi:hypothetical protein